MLKNIILTTFSLASIFGINLIYFNNDIKVDNLQQREYKKQNSPKTYTSFNESEYVKEIVESKPSKRDKENNSSIKAYIRSLKQEAEALFNQGKYQEALKEYDKIIKITIPTNP